MNSPRFAITLLASVNLILLTIISAAPAVVQGAAPPRAVSSDQIAPYMKPQRLIRIAGGRTINLVCLGQGSPTVILTAGLGGWSFIWNRIQGPLSPRSRVCAWDPAGLGFSSPSPEAQDAIHETEDLEEALKGAHIEGPYVMVAHSAGAYVTLRFTDQHRKTVGGMVLVDPSIPDETAVRERVAPRFAALGDAAPRAEVTRLRQCAAELQSGALKAGTPGFDGCTAQPLPAAFSRLSVALARLNADPARLLTQASAIENASSRSGREVINAQRRYGDMPLIVLTSGRHPCRRICPPTCVSRRHSISGLSRPVTTPTLRYPRADTTSLSRIPGILFNSRIPRRFSRRSTACWRTLGRNGPINPRSTDKVLVIHRTRLRPPGG